MAILLVFPEGPTRDAAVEALRRSGHEVRPASNAFRAVSELAGRPAECVVLDLTPLAERDLEVIPVLKELVPGVSIILAFPPTQRELAAKALGLGADAYLPEPFYMDELVSLVARTAVRPSPASSPLIPTDDLLQKLAEDAAHEINNPLQVIQLLYDGQTGRTAPGRSKVQPHLGRIGGVGRLLAELGQLPRGTPLPPVDVASLLEEARASVGDAAEPSPLPAVSSVEGYADFLGAMLEGLLRRATAGGAPATSTCRDGEVGGHACVEVLIEGPARPESERSIPGEDPAQGPLFLTFCRIVVLRHGGLLEIEESPAEGTRYRVLLPALAPRVRRP
jgi:DNA-binding response OmpR family regulator